MSALRSTSPSGRWNCVKFFYQLQEALLTYWWKLSQLYSGFFEYRCCLVLWVRRWYLNSSRYTYNWINAVVVTVDNLTYSYLRNLDTARQAWTAGLIVRFGVKSMRCTHVLQYRVDPSLILSLPASRRAFSSAWRHKHVSSLTPDRSPALQRWPLWCQLQRETQLITPFTHTLLHYNLSFLAVYHCSQC